MEKANVFVSVVMQLVICNACTELSMSCIVCVRSMYIHTFLFNITSIIKSLLYTAYRFLLVVGTYNVYDVKMIK